MPGQNRFPRSERLTRKGEYLKVYDEGYKRVGSAFVCYVVRQEGQGRKMGFAVSRKVGKAVVRNRVKRYLREIYRSHRAELRDDAHIVFVARAAAADMDYHECREAIRRLLLKGGLLDG